MIIRQSRQVKHARAVLSAALLALALTIVPSTALADEPVEDEQLVVVDEGQEVDPEDDYNGQNHQETAAVSAQVVVTDNTVCEQVDQVSPLTDNQTATYEEEINEQTRDDANDGDQQVFDPDFVPDNNKDVPTEEASRDDALDTRAPDDSQTTILLGSPSEEGEDDGSDSEPATPPLPDGTYVIQTGVGGVTGVQVLDVTGGKAENKANIETYSFKDGDNQKWDLRWVAESEAYIIAMHGTSYVLDVDRGVAENNRNVILYSEGAGKQNQLWTINKYGDGWTIHSLLDSTYVLDVFRERNANGTNVALYTSKGNSAQLFYLLALDATPVGNYMLSDGVYQVAPSADGTFALDVHGDSIANAANVEIYRAKDGQNQKWQFTRESDGFYTITVVSSGKVLDVDHNSPIPGTNIIQYSAKGSSNQKWAVNLNDDGTLTFINKSTGLVLDVSGGTMANSSNVIGYRNKGNANQRWTLTSVDYINPGIYEIKPLSNDGVSLDMRGGKASEGADAMLYRDTNSLNQRYQLVRVGANKYKVRTGDSGGWLTDDGTKAIQTGNSGTESTADIWEAFWNGGYFSLRNIRTNKVIDLNGSAVSGTATKTSSANGTASQHFRFVPTSLIEPGIYEIHSGINTAYTLDVSGASAASGANIILYTDKSSANQYFRIEKYGSGYKITSLYSGHAVVGGAASGANVSQQAFTGGNSQIWIPVIMDGGFIAFQNAANTSVVLDVAGDTAANKANVQVETADGSSGQKWKLAAVKIGWYQRADGHWSYISADPRAHFDYDLDSTGKSLGHYDVLYRLWYRVNGYKSGSKKPYGSRTNYLIVSAWDDCYLGVFVGVGNPNSAGYWQPLYGWNCGNGNRNVINEDARKQAEREGRTTTWSWDPEWDYALALNNDTASRDNLPDNNQWARPLSSSNYRLLRIPNNNMERYFTSVRMTLGYHSTITSNPSSELGRHVSHGCIRLDVNNARTLYALMGTKGKTTKDLNGNVITYSNGQAIVGVGPGTRCIQLSSSKGSY